MTPKRRVIPVFVPHLGCPNDCVFCNQRRISGRQQAATPETVKQAVEAIPELMTGDIPVQLAFYGGSFTAIPVGEQNALLAAAGPFLARCKNASLRVSTRPDCIDGPTLERLFSYGVKTVELGAQSMCRDVLEASQRGHTPEDTVSASHAIRQAGMELILQMMTGLPEDTPEKSVYTAEKLIELCPDGVRVYPTVVIRDTQLYEMWRRGEYREHTVDEAAAVCARLHERFEQAKIPIIRMGINPTEALTGGDAAAGAYHPAFGELVLSKVYLNRALALLGPLGRIKSLTLGVRKDRISCMVGHAKCNIKALERRLGPNTVRVAAADVQPGEIVIMCIEKDA